MKPDILHSRFGLNFSVQTDYTTVITRSAHFFSLKDSIMIWNEIIQNDWICFVQAECVEQHMQWYLEKKGFYKILSTHQKTQLEHANNSFIFNIKGIYYEFILQAHRFDFTINSPFVAFSFDFWNSARDP